MLRKVQQFIDKNHLLNVNFPNGEYKGIALSNLYYRKDYQYMVKQDDGGYYAYRKMEDDFSKYPDSDCYHVSHGIVSITPLNKSYFDKSIYEKLKKKCLKVK